MSIRTFSQTESDLAFQWVDKYFKLVELIIEISDNDGQDISTSEPSFEKEVRYQELRVWFLAHQDKFIPIWSEFWRDKNTLRDSVDKTDGQEYFENPFLMLYKPDNLYQLVYRLGIIENFDTWELTEQSTGIIKDIKVEFSLEVLQFIHFVGEFAGD